MPSVPPDQQSPYGPGSGDPTLILLTIPEVLVALRISRAKFYCLARSGAIPVHKLLGSSRVFLSDLRQYIRNLPRLHGSDVEGS